MGYGDGDLICPPWVRGLLSCQQLEVQTEPRSQGSWVPGSMQRHSHTDTTVETSFWMNGWMFLYL